jgi:hypothetical protein
MNNYNSNSKMLTDYDLYNNKNVYSIIRILQKDVFNNKYDWLSEIMNNIESISNENSIQNIFMCKNDEYKNYL